MEEYINVGVFLFSQAASSQLSSALLSLTSVFGMGTGGPSASSTPTIYLHLFTFLGLGDPCENRTRVAAVRGRSTRPLYDGAATSRWRLAGIPGLEPRTKEPETFVLPITPYPITLLSYRSVFRLSAFHRNE